MAKPELTAVPEFYHGYVRLVGQDDLYEALRYNTEESIRFLQDIPEDQWDFRYAEGKWSIKEVVQHIIDAERIFSYRALRFARQDKTELPGFDENTYGVTARAGRRTKQELIEEYKAVRVATSLLFSSFDEEQLASSGIANKKTISVNAIGFITAGHVLHHMAVLQERYLQ